MKADNLTMLQVLSNNAHYALPHFQREYAWNKEQWQTLFDDILGIYDEYSEKQPPEHFLGSLVVVEDGIVNGVVPAFKVVDGQQRLTSLSLLIHAISQICRETHPEIAAHLQMMLFNQLGKDKTRFKLLPTAKYGDQACYIALLEGKVPPPAESGIPHALAFFLKELQKRPQLDIEKLRNVVLNCVHVVFISLGASENPYRIFESLNGKGKPLSQADLVRNYLAMRLPANRQQQVFEEDWAPIEYSLQEKRLVGRIGELTAFLRHYLALRTGTLPNENHVYARFRDYSERSCADAEAFESEIKTLRRFAQHYDTFLRPQHETEKDAREVLQRLQSLDATTAHPFLLALFEARENGSLSHTQWQQSLAVIENYLVRRYLCSEPVNYLNKMFAALWSELDASHLVESLQSLLSRKKYPTNRRVEQGVLNGLFYGNPSTRQKTSFIFECINRRLSTGSGGYTILNGSDTIEHIMPQTLSESWCHELGENAETVHNELLHTLGNLTIVTQEWNSSLSNAPFGAKKQRLQNHALKLNSDYFSQEIVAWNEGAIRARAHWLYEQIVALWPAFEYSIEEKNVSTITWRKPILLHVKGETYNITSWRDVMRHTAEHLIANHHFSAVAPQMPSYFRQEPFASSCSQLSNGWWLMVNVSGNEAVSRCRRMVELAGYDAASWHVDEEEIPYQTSVG